MRNQNTNLTVRRMRSVMRLLPVLLGLAFPVQSHAMNPEGHDGSWLDELPYAALLMAAAPGARPLPSRQCLITAEILAANPYEQIPLPRHQCSDSGTAGLRQLPPTAGNLVVQEEHGDE